MNLGLLTTQDKELIRAVLAETLGERDEVLAVYLFGSCASDEPVVNDIDVLLLVREQDLGRRFMLLTELAVLIAERLGLSSDNIDLIPFDLDMVQPYVLHAALETGLLLKCTDEEALTDAIESLSRYFLENEPILRRQELLRREMFS